MSLYLHSIKRNITGYGVGVRTVLFFQGCLKQCKECNSPELQTINLSITREVEEVYPLLINDPFSTGITLTGGEPLLQHSAILPLLQKLNGKLHICCYTGYTFEDIISGYNRQRDDLINMLKYIDVLIDGPYIPEFKSNNYRYAKSSNQRILDCKESIKKRTPVLMLESPWMD